MLKRGVLALRKFIGHLCVIDGERRIVAKGLPPCSEDHSV